MNWSQDNLRLPSMKKGRQHVAIAVGISFALHAVLIAAAGSLLGPGGSGVGPDEGVIVAALVELPRPQILDPGSKILETVSKIQDPESQKTEVRRQKTEVRSQKSEDSRQSFNLAQDPERAEGKTELEKQAPVSSSELAKPSSQLSVLSPQSVEPSTQHPVPSSGITGPGLQIAMAGGGVATGLLGGSTFSQISIIDLPRPVYPGRSRRHGEEGRVILSVRIGVDGQVINASIDTSSNYQRLDLAAVKAIGRGTFRPAMINGEFIESTCKVAYLFKLEGNE